MKRKSLWSFGGWLCGSALGFGMIAIGIRMPWPEIAMITVYVIGWLKAKESP